MAEIRDDLILDVDRAIASIDSIQTRLNTRPLTANVDVEVDTGSFRDLDSTLDQIEANVADITQEIAAIETGADRADVSFKDLASSLGVSEDAARRLAAETLEADRAAKRVDESARDVAQALGLADDDARRFAQELGKASREADQVDDRMARVATTVSRLRGLIIGAVAAIGVRGLVRGADSAIDSYNLLTESVNAVNVVFEEGADAVFAFGENVARTAGLARGEFQQAVIPIGALLRNFGFDARDAGDAAVVLTQRAADLASVFNTDVQTALDAIAAGLRGEANPLERFGAGISAARVEAFALSEGLVNTKSEITDLVRVQARYLLILEDTAKAQGDFENTADDPANAARRLAAGVEEAQAALGEKLIPAYLTILEVTPDVITALEDVGPAVESIATAFANSADEFAGFAVGLLNVIATLPLQIQILVAQAKTLPEGLLSVFDSIRGALGLDGLVGNFDDVAGGLTDISDRTRILNNLYSQLDLIIAIQEGIDPLIALEAAIRTVAGEAGDLNEVFKDFARTADLDDVALAAGLEDLIANAQQLRLSGDDVAFLRFQLALLKDEIAFPPGSFDGIITPLQQLPGEVEPGIISLGDLRAAAEAAGVTIQEALGSDLFPAGSIFDKAAVAEAELAGFRDRINTIGAEIDPFKEAAEQIDISAAEFTANAVAQLEQSVEFEVALARLGARGFTALEDALRAGGPGALTVAEEFLNDTALARASEDALRSGANVFATDYIRLIGEELRTGPFTGLPDDVAQALAGLNPAVAARLADEFNTTTAFTAQLTSAEAAGEFTIAGQQIAETTAQGFADRVAELAPSVGFDAALDLARAMTSAESEAEATRAGGEWARVFSQAFKEGVTFDFQPPNFPSPTSPTGTTTSPTGPNEGLPVANSFEFNIYNPEGQDYEVMLTQAEQAAQTISTLL